MTNAFVPNSRFVPVVNRDEEVREATKRIDNMLSDLKVEDCVLFYYGVSMVGKTTLLNKIKDEASQKGLVTGHVDFDREQVFHDTILHNSYDGTSGKIRLTKRLMEDFSLSGEFAPAREIGFELDPLEATEKLLMFARDLYRFKRQRPYVLCFDTLEDADIENLIWLQEAIVEPFINEFHTLVVFAGRTAPNTRQRDLIHPLERRLAKSDQRLYHLRPFTDAQTSKQIENIGASSRISITAHDLSQHTGGLPGLNDAAIRWLISDKSVERLLPHLVNEIIFKRMANKIDEDLKAEIITLSPMRLFDSGLISRIVKNFWPTRYGEDSLRQVRQLLNKFQETRLVEPHPDGYGYAIPYDIRLVISQYWSGAETRKYYETHILAADWFLDQVISDDFVAITDFFYHLRFLSLGFRENPTLITELISNQGSILQRVEAQRVSQLFEDDFFVDIMQRVLRDLHKKSSRAFDLADQITRILEKQEFAVAFESHLKLLQRLQQVCLLFKERL